MSSNGSRLVWASLLLAAAACDGPTTPPPVEMRRVIAEGSFTIGTAATSSSANPCGFVAFFPFATNATATIETVVDWTFASSNIDVGIMRGGCSCAQIISQTCQTVAESVSTTAKPERVVALSQPAGNYTMVVANFTSGTQTESCSYQIIQATLP